MQSAHTKNSFSRTALLFGLALAALIAAGRIIQLAWEGEAPAEPNTGTRAAQQELRPPANSLATASRFSPQSKAAKSIDAELESFYAACPMAAVIDLKTVTSSPERVDAILPPYRQTARRVPKPPAEPAIPRIRYPVAVRANESQAPQQDNAIRVAQKPAATGSSGERASDGAKTIEPSPDPSLKGRGNRGDWLIDPSEWYVGGVSDADSSAKTSEPGLDAQQKTENANQSASEQLPTIPPPPYTPRRETTPPRETPSPETPTRDNPPVESTDPAPAAPSNDVAPIPPTVVGDANAETPAKTSEPASDAQQSTESEKPTVTKPLFPPPTPAGPPSTASPGASANAVDPHLELFAKNEYPSARECAQCHEEIYNDWSISAHAYAAVSPMFHKFEQKLNDLSQGTVGYFCMRCHAPVATALCATRDQPLWTLPEVAREGITCIACHRVQYVYGKSNGERRIELGNVFAPVMGGIGGDGVAETIHRKDHFKVKTSPDEKGPGQNIHASGIYFEPLTRSEFCTPCHQVAVHPGIKLEVVWEQYRASPACKKGIQCQDCHMGRVPGLPLGYDCGPVAKIAGKTVNDHRKKSNHVFFGPNYPIAHPGVFPFHLKANRWTMDQWLTFDWRAGWGTKEFEERVADGQLQVSFPPVWAEADDRYDAREIIDENLKKMARKRDLRIQVMENGSHVDGPFFDSPLCRGHDLAFHYVVTNTNEGHNLLTASLGAQPQLWANVVLIGPDGARLWETGYMDTYGDLANIHSEDVRHHRMPYDWQLFNLQTMFLIQGAVGTDREFYVPVNFDFDQLPFIRPGVQPISVINHPPTIRMESRSLAPLGSRKARYHIPSKLLQQPGTYRLAFRLRSRSEPPYFMRFCGATEEMLRAENEWMIDVHPMTVEFQVR